MIAQYYCQNTHRRSLIRDNIGADGNPIVNGIDYLEVSEDQLSLSVFFIHNLPGEADGVPAAPLLTSSNVVIEGGVRIKNVRVLSVTQADNLLTVRVDKPGDFSTYHLRISSSSTGTTPPSGFDPQLSNVDFSFKVDCPEDFDCAPDDDCPPEEVAIEPPIDYLAKDYASFRQLMLDRLSVVIPDWAERNAADLGTALVEVIAYTADQLSYYQDAVANEAYLGTARRRVSARRHARILDYNMHEGCNSRALVQVWVVGSDNVSLESGAVLFTKVEGNAPVVNTGSRELEEIEAHNPLVFETMHDELLHPAHNEIGIYTWGDDECCLPTGATRATLQDDAGSRLLLRPGDLLVFEEVKGTTESGQPDPSHRHAVRLASVSPQATLSAGNTRTPGTLTTDPLTGQAIVEIEWDYKDALPFPLCISTGEFEDISVARGNLVMVSNGSTVTERIEVPKQEFSSPSLDELEITFSEDYDHETAVTEPAEGLLKQDYQKALPEVALEQLIEVTVDHDELPSGMVWNPRRDLLNSARSATDFVLETADDKTNSIRFGDGVMGRKPPAGTAFTATYRVGNGRSGNVGADAIFHIQTDDANIISVRNPMPAKGGTDSELIDQVKLHAPQAFQVQERAVTEEDYAEVAERHGEVQKAVATRRWTGSWHTMFLTVDRKAGRPVDADFEDELRSFMEHYRLAGHDLEVVPPIFVALEIVMTVCVLPGYFQSNVKDALLEVFSADVLADGRHGFWHPDEFTFGQTVYLSQIVAAAMEVEGVMWVEISTFKRWGKADLGDIQEGRLLMGREQIAQLENDSSQPDNGRMSFEMDGGA